MVSGSWNSLQAVTESESERAVLTLTGVAAVRVVVLVAFGLRLKQLHAAEICAAA